MGLDIKLPIGLMFIVFGFLLTLYGVLTYSNTEMYKTSLGININLWTGGFMIVLGIILLIFARRIKKSQLDLEGETE
jgi:nitrate reductase gamma subunit